MNKVVVTRGLFAASLLLVLAVNAVVLLGVAANRRGPAVRSIILTERELRLPARIQAENSGLSLRLIWRASPVAAGNAPEWLDAAKLRELQVRLEPWESYQAPAREVFVVLEYDGDMYRQALEKSKADLAERAAALALDPQNETLQRNHVWANNRLENEHKAESRLFALDAGLDVGALRAKYADASKYIITRGKVRPRRSGRAAQEVFYGYLADIKPVIIHVPLDKRRVLDALPARARRSRSDIDAPPRYKVELAYGRRLEPWIVDVQPVSGGPER